MDADVNPFSAEDGPATTRSRMSGLLRATQVLDRLVVEAKATSAYDLAKAIHAPVSTIYGVVDALVQAGLLERDTAGAVWFGSRMYHYGLAYGRNVDLLREARTEMRLLAHELGETVQICARHEGFVVIQDMAEASRNLRVSSRIGAREPINWSVSGRFFLAHLPQQEQLEIFRQNAVPSATGRAPLDPGEEARNRATVAADLAVRDRDAHDPVLLARRPISGPQEAPHLVVGDRDGEEQVQGPAPGRSFGHDFAARARCVDVVHDRRTITDPLHPSLLFDSCDV